MKDWVFSPANEKDWLNKFRGVYKLKIGYDPTEEYDAQGMDNLFLTYGHRTPEGAVDFLIQKYDLIDLSSTLRKDSK